MAPKKASAHAPNYITTNIKCKLADTVLNCGVSTPITAITQANVRHFLVTLHGAPSLVHAEWNPFRRLIWGSGLRRKSSREGIAGGHYQGRWRWSVGDAAARRAPDQWTSSMMIAMGFNCRDPVCHPRRLVRAVRCHWKEIWEVVLLAAFLLLVAMVDPLFRKHFLYHPNQRYYRWLRCANYIVISRDLR